MDKPIAYGSSVSTSNGVLCIGGDDSKKVYTDVFMLSWNARDKKLSKKEMPSLPGPVAYGSAAIHNDTVYLVAGQSGKKLETATGIYGDHSEPQCQIWYILPLNIHYL